MQLQAGYAYDCANHEAIDAAMQNQEAQQAIICTDGFSPRHLNYTKRDVEAHYKDLMRFSPTAAPIWALVTLECYPWTARPSWWFQGPWDAEPANPILFVGNSMDPVTPVDSAREQVKRFKGSRVLTQDGPGHCSISMPSFCTILLVKEYFRSGKLPDEGTVCKPNFGPFDGIGGLPRTWSEEVTVLHTAQQHLGNILEEVGTGFGRPKLGPLRDTRE